ncbi:hypothetical protein NBH00_20580 [Paraconexibacter antarcticus]|uniref:Diacylglycerol glucosyltransferase N-terminal domain-containing protein n=1 Tax=Paraconexibacter antarcticus TaxID=2949664 RepID=A0ABY5DRM2_9ACTN|nr:hypothetical protein [Paraconexibacter antarcticus]UTI63727.1 hypothetical protein NBH00_20580 [Paraconexibacter antarcticus]
MPRVLVVTADIGAGHDLPAARLREALAARGASVEVVDGLDLIGGLLRRLVRDGIEERLLAAPDAYDWQYRLLVRPRARRAASRIAGALGGPALLGAAAAADVVVSTYPGTTEILGRLRAAGRLRTPVVSAITDLSALWGWAHPGVDLHLLVHPESAGEVRWIAGPGARTITVRGLSDAGFEAPPPAAEARRALGLPRDGPVVAVSGGGWGVGDVGGAVAVARGRGAQAVVLCGTNEPLRRRMDAAGAGVHALGFTDRMPEVLAAADVLVHGTAGLTVLEALVCGTRPISYGWGVGHIRVNNRAYAATGLAQVAADAGALAVALDGALAAPLAPDPGYAQRPHAADAVLGLL